MVKIKSGIVVFFFLLSFDVYSQDVKWSAPFENERKLSYLKILGAGENGYFMLRSNMSFNSDRVRSGSKSRRYELQYYSTDLHLRWGQPVVPSCENCQVADIEMTGSGVTILLSQFDRKKKTYRLFAEQIAEDGKSKGGPKTLMEMTVKKADEDNRPALLVSHDQRLIACTYRMMPKNKESQIYSVIVFDTSLTVLYRKEFNIPVSPRRFAPLSTVLTDSGNFFLLGIEYTTEKRIKNPGEILYKLYSYIVNTDKTTVNEISLGDKFLTDVGISADNLNRRMVVAGFYSDKTTYSTAGVFYYALSEDSLKETPVVTSSFNNEFLRKFAGERKENNNKELTNYSIDRIVLRKDGGAAILAESYYTTMQSYWDYYMQMWVYHYYYHFGNIISLSINPEGSLLWSNVITKDQNSTDDGGYYSSYYSAIMSGKIYLFYNKYLTTPGSVLSTSISGGGIQDTKTLFREGENVTVVPHSAKQVDEATILISVLKDDKSYLAKITF